MQCFARVLLLLVWWFGFKEWKSALSIVDCSIWLIVVQVKGRSHQTEQENVEIFPFEREGGDIPLSFFYCFFTGENATKWQRKYGKVGRKVQMGEGCEGSALNGKIPIFFRGERPHMKWSAWSLLAVNVLGCSSIHYPVYVGIDKAIGSRTLVCAGPRVPMCHREERLLLARLQREGQYGAGDAGSHFSDSETTSIQTNSFTNSP